jgi:hypothetical protein
MGQDREFTDGERKLALDICLKFKQSWETSQARLLIQDRDRKIKAMETESELVQEV